MENTSQTNNKYEKKIYMKYYLEAKFMNEFKLVPVSLLFSKRRNKKYKKTRGGKLVGKNIEIFYIFKLFYSFYSFLMPYQLIEMCITYK